MDQARRWLVPDRNTAEDVVEQVDLERFVEWLPARTSAWVRYHRPEFLGWIGQGFHWLLGGLWGCGRDR